MSASSLLSGTPAAVDCDYVSSITPPVASNLTLQTTQSAASAAGIVVKSATAAGGAPGDEATTSLYIENPSRTAAWRWCVGGSGGGGVVQNHLQLFEYSNGTYNTYALNIDNVSGVVSHPATLQSGSGTIALGANSVVVNNAAVGAGSIIMITPTALDATARNLTVSAKAAGSFTVSASANATAATTFDWFVVKL